MSDYEYDPSDMSPAAREYWRTVDPETGEPAPSQFVSVTRSFRSTGEREPAKAPAREQDEWMAALYAASRPGPTHTPDVAETTRLREADEQWRAMFKVTKR